MGKIEIDELRKLQVEMLNYIDMFCKKNNLNYSLCGGTLLGAVRHKGYIPWDDDIDIFMPRNDYEKFIELQNKEFGKYKIINPFTTKGCFIPFSKFINTETVLIENNDRKLIDLGVYIDIFPIDGLPNNEKTRQKYWNFIKKVKRLNTCVYEKTIIGESFCKRLFRKIVFYAFAVLDKSIVAKYINKQAMKYKIEDSDFVACSVFGYGQKEEMSKTAIETFIDLDFEQLKFKSIAGYETYLSNVYGNYMELPPLEKRVAKHEQEVYYK